MEEVNISFLGNTISQARELKIRQGIMTEKQFRQLPSATVDAVINGNYLGVVRLITNEDKVIPYIVIGYNGCIYKDTKEDLIKLINSDATLKNKSDSITFTEEEKSKLEDLEKKQSEIYTKYTLASLLNKIELGGKIYDIKEEKSGSYIKVDISSGEGTVGTYTRLDIRGILDEQKESDKYETDITSDIITGFISDDTFNNEVRKLFEKKYTEISRLAKQELKDWFTGSELSDTNKFKQDVKNFKSIAEKYKCKTQCLAGYTTEDEYSDITIGAKIKVMMTGNSRHYTVWDIEIGTLDIELKLFKGSIEMIKEKAAKLGIVGDDQELLDIDKEFNNIGNEIEKIEVDLEDRVNAEKIRFESILSNMDGKIRAINNIALLISQ